MSPFLCQQKTLRENRKENKQWLLGTSCRVIMLVLVVMLGVLFVWQTSSASTKGFALSDLQKKVNDLEKANEKLALEIASQRSLQNVEARAPELGLVPTEQVSYATILGTAVARR